MNSTSTQPARAMTLIETLVVLGVIALLAGLLMPALASVRTSAKQMQCQSNLRQMMIAANTYSATWDAYPAAIRYDNAHGVAHVIAWDWVTVFGTGELIGPGPLWHYTDNPDHVMQCPAYSGPSNFNGDPHTGYNYNTDHIGAEAEYVGFGWNILRPGLKPHAAHRPSSASVFGCSSFSGGANKFMRDPDNPNALSLQLTYSGGQAFHYAGHTNAAMLDGHVRTFAKPHPGEHATESLLHLLDHPRNGFLSDDGEAYDPR